jgi:hypothetical protein
MQTSADRLTGCRRLSRHSEAKALLNRLETSDEAEAQQRFFESPTEIIMTRRRPSALLLSIALLSCNAASPSLAATGQVLPPPTSLAESPWNGDWVLSQTRNTPQIKDAAAAGYRFHLQSDGQIRWEIPSLHEVVEGRTDGRPMKIRRPNPTALTLAVTAEGPWVLRYTVSRNGQPEGEGRMTLVDQGRAWVDLSQPAGRPDLAGVVVYVRPAEAAK